MVRKVTDYVCDVCDGTIRGTLEQAQDHEKIPKDNSLPIGFVCLSYFNDKANPHEHHSLIISSSYGSKRNRIITDPENEFHHAYNTNVVRISNHEDGLRYSHGLGPENSKFFRRLFEANPDRVNRILTDEEFEEFKELYGADKPDIVGYTGIPLEQLTNRLD